ncbi:hypothetical protein NBRC3257_1732 [Gluconobacter thailandicus NBRC 3257]|uniref:Transmembrane protein n=1 Tax=Gluconobacter thailandicus NBRC 3257 TaxID=1381097 RepID=A0ABQ0IYY8_GLUTH|nr:hypothetical protein [Gluconobacter thailandicus]KXV53819.1 hypothetical protein AD946_05985 [Gluconobacter thailandicus]GAC88704.1 hypothetical protein NBRC3255_2365 [Gluconobacter thailandicus NBRC 3255]GAD26733.1 hypothetical protein NBRC3257_1732 [Gluconobacter thailandicus NBRC 3257]
MTKETASIMSDQNKNLPASQPQAVNDYEAQMQALIHKLPGWMQRTLSWLRKPERKWVRIPAGVLFMLGGCMAFLPVLGAWMVPVGILLLSEDIPFFRRLMEKALNWIQRKHPDWMDLPSRAK